MHDARRSEAPAYEVGVFAGADEVIVIGVQFVEDMLELDGQQLDW